VLSFLGVGGRLHLPHAHLGHGGAPYSGASRLGASHGGAPHGATSTPTVAPVNFATVTAFLAWFGGTGYLMMRYTAVWLLVTLGAAIASGVGGAAVVFWFLVKLAAHDVSLDPADYEMVGVLGRISSTVRPEGTGEMIFSRHGARCSSPVRSEDGSVIPRSADVVVTRYEKGIAYVRRFEDLGS
jgi:hypothetical protein